MPFISREDAVTTVGPYLPDLEAVVRSAWRDWLGGGLCTCGVRCLQKGIAWRSHLHWISL